MAVFIAIHKVDGKIETHLFKASFTPSTQEVCMAFGITLRRDRGDDLIVKTCLNEVEIPTLVRAGDMVCIGL